MSRAMDNPDAFLQDVESVQAHATPVMPQGLARSWRQSKPARLSLNAVKIGVLVAAAIGSLQISNTRQEGAVGLEAEALPSAWLRHCAILPARPQASLPVAREEHVRCAIGNDAWKVAVFHVDKTSIDLEALRLALRLRREANEAPMARAIPVGKEQSSWLRQMAIAFNPLVLEGVFGIDRQVEDATFPDGRLDSQGRRQLPDAFQR